MFNLKSAVCWHEVSLSLYPSVHAGDSPRVTEHLGSHPSWQLVSPLRREAFGGYNAGAATSSCTVLQGRGRGEVSNPCHSERDTKVPCCGECPARQGLEKEEGKLFQPVKFADRIKAVVRCFKPKLFEVQY